MSNPLAVALLASASQTANGNGSAIDTSLDADATAGVYPRSAAELLLQCTAASGTLPTLDVHIESSFQATGPWEVADSFTQLTGTGFQRLRVVDLERYVRVRWVVDGTGPDFTFEVDGHSHTCYAGTADLIVKDEVTADVTKARIAKHLLEATGMVRSYVSGAHSGFLTAWGGDIRSATATIATKHILDDIGWRPGADFDQQIVSRYIYMLGNPDIAGSRGWLHDVRSGTSVPDGLADATPEVFEGHGYVVSDPPRGW